MKPSTPFRRCSIYMLAPSSHTQMMGFVVYTPDGELLVIDGGTRADADFLLETMKKVTGKAIPEVKAWFLTHPHLDHIDALLELYDSRAGNFKVDTIYHAFPSRDWFASIETVGKDIHTVIEYEAAAQKHSFPEIRLSKGDLVEAGGASFETLYVSDPGITTNAINNSSTVLRMECEGVSVMFLGDLGAEGGEILLESNPPGKLRADVVQLAHHGQGGVRFPVYEAIAPSLALWCTPQWLWDNNQGSRGSGSGPWTVEETKTWLQELGVVDQIVSKDGTFRIDLEAGTYRVNRFDARE